MTDGRLVAVAETPAIDAARYGVAVAFPYYDRCLIAFCHRLSSTETWTGGQSRSVMRRATLDLLPEMIRTQAPKSPDDSASVLRLVEMRAEIEKVLDTLEATDATDVFNVSALKAALTAWPSETDTHRNATALARQDTARGATPILATLPLTMARSLGP